MYSNALLIPLSYNFIYLKRNIQKGENVFAKVGLPSLKIKIWLCLADNLASQITEVACAQTKAFQGSQQIKYINWALPLQF